MNTSTAQEREAFEAIAKRRGYSLRKRSDGGYFNSDTAEFYYGWQARASAPLQVSEDVAKEIYEAMRWAATNMLPENKMPPEWCDGGNSYAQDMARLAAGKITKAVPFNEEMLVSILTPFMPLFGGRGGYQSAANNQRKRAETAARAIITRLNKGD